MKRTLPVFVAMLLLFTAAQTSHSRDTDKALRDVVIRVGYVEFPGLTHTDPHGKPAGLVNEITIKTLERAGIKYTIAAYPAARLFDELSKGKIDLFNGLGTIPSIRLSTLQSRLNLFPLEMRVYSAGLKKTIHRKEDLAASSVILVRGFTYNDWGGWIRNSDSGVAFHETDTHEAAFDMLKRGRADYLLTYKYIGEICLKNIKIPDLRYQTPSSAEGWHCTFNLYKNKPQAKLILKKLEDSYLQLIKEGNLKNYN